jgi:hypothetical protein
MTVVFDTSVVVEAIFWPRSTARRALTGLAKRRFQTGINSAIAEEYAAITAQVREKLFSETQPSGGSVRMRTTRQRPRAAPKPARNRQNFPLDTAVAVGQHWNNMSEAGNQFSLTREATITGGAAKKQSLRHRCGCYWRSSPWISVRASTGWRPSAGSGSRPTR